MTRTPPDTGLTDGELHVWIADLDATWPTEPQKRRGDLLSADERQRATRFAHKRDRERWAHSRALLRLLLSRYLSADPADLRFELGEHGKPELASAAPSNSRAGCNESKLRFNLSHSGSIGLYAFALNNSVGVDVETPGRDIDVLAVAKRALGEEVAERLGQLDGERREWEFLRAWVRHEAILKCTGVGLAGAEDTASAGQAWVSELKLDRAVGAVAAASQPTSISCQRFIGTEGQELERPLRTR